MIVCITIFGQRRELKEMMVTEYVVLREEGYGGKMDHYTVLCAAQPRGKPFFFLPHLDLENFPAAV